MKKTILDFEKYKLDIQKVLSGDPIETCEATVRLFLETKLLTPEQLADQEFKFLQIQLINRINGYQYSNGESGLGLILQGQALEPHQMIALEKIDPKFQEQASAHEIFNILGQLKKHQTDILCVTGIPQGTNILEYMLALHELKKHQTDIFWIFGFPKEITPIDYFNLLKNLDVYKTNILKNIPKKTIQQGTTLSAIIRTLHNMQVIKNEKTTQLHFEGNIDQNIIQIITDTLYEIAGVKSENRLKFVAINKKYEQIDTPGECEIKNLSQICENILSKHPDCYIKITGNLDAKKLQKNYFDFLHLKHIVIDGDFICSKHNKFFPHRVDGTFDCSGLGKDYITKDIVLPITQKINCAYSITDFDVLMNIMPKQYDKNYDEFDTTCVKTLIVEPKLIKKEFLSQNKEHFTNVLNFIEHYPYVTVLDTKGNNLLDMLVEKCRDKKITPEPTVIEITTTPSEKIFEQKIQNKHLEVKEILTILRTLPQYNIYTDGELDRFIRLVLSDQRKNGIQKKTMRRADDVNVICIDASQIELVKQDLQNVINERIKEEKNITEYIPTKTNEFLKTEPVKRKPIKIKKYITPDILKKIEKSSKQNVNTVLQAINEINLDPLEMQLQGPVHIIKDGKETVSATVTREAGCCLVQSIDSSNHTDPKRVVWGIADGPDGLIIISIGYREHHNTKKASNLYADLRNQALKKQTYTQQELNNKGYVDIETLITNNNSDDSVDLPLPNNDLFTQKMTSLSQKTY